MSDQSREPAYRDALNAAYGDLEAISQKIDELRARKESVELATGALKALLGLSDVSAETARPVAASRPVYEISTGNPQQNRESGDMLQNQIRQALGMAATA